MPKVPGSGRKRGTPNKKTQELLEICNSMNCDPFRGLLELTRDDDKNIRLAALKEVCQYLYPKRKAVEQTLTALSDKSSNSDVLVAQAVGLLDARMDERKA